MQNLSARPLFPANIGVGDTGRLFTEVNVFTLATVMRTIQVEPDVESPAKW